MPFQDPEAKDFLRGNQNLKASTAKEYIDEKTMKFRIEEMKKIFADILYFIKNYFYIISLDEGKILLNPYPKQAQIIQDFVKYDKNICLASRQSGKCLFSSTYIKIRSKITGKIQEITIFDFFERIKNSK